MCIKNKIVAVALCAVVMFVGVFALGSVTAQAQSTAGTTSTTSTLSRDQLQQIIDQIRQQIQQLIPLIQQRIQARMTQPQVSTQNQTWTATQTAVCGNSVCDAGETNANCAADCPNCVGLNQSVPAASSAARD
jgi:predicted PurR-regulated permease PerM